MEKIILGSHVSFNKNDQLIGSIKEALSYGANTFMFYTGAPQNTNRSPIDVELTHLAHKILKEEGIDPAHIIVHAPYIINLANRNHFDFSIRFLREEIRRVESLGFKNLVLHPGSHVGVGIEEGISTIVSALNATVDSKTKVKICIETMAGKGTECGKSFEEIRKIIDGVKEKDKIGVCLDTCHIFDAGYELSDVDRILDEFDRIIGLSYLSCIHINDSKNSKGSHKDRHENIGFGHIGFSTLLQFLYHPKLKDVPKILETPYVTKQNSDKKRLYPPYKFEIAMIQNKEWNSHLIEDIRTYYK